MPLNPNDLILVTGATGLVGSHVVERARQRNLRTRVLARPASDTRLLEEWGAERIAGDVTDPASLGPAVDGATVIVHCAARVGDWGPVEDYRAANVQGLENLIAAARRAGTLRRFLHVSSLGVYPARDHHGTDESLAPAARGIDGYTRSKIEAEEVIRRHVAEGFPAVILRPGFIYGPRDRTVLPRILERLRQGTFMYLGSGRQLMNNTCVDNLVDAVFLAVEHDDALGRTYNITDARLVSKEEFIGTVAELAGYRRPTKKVPLPVARIAARILEGTWKLLGKRQAPLLSSARIKFLGLNLHFSIERAQRELGYQPRVDFTEGMRQTIEWFRREGMLKTQG